MDLDGWLVGWMDGWMDGPLFCRKRPSCQASNAGTLPPVLHVATPARLGGVHGEDHLGVKLIHLVSKWLYCC